MVRRKIIREKTRRKFGVKTCPRVQRMIHRWKSRGRSVLQVSFGTQNTKLRVPSVLYVSRTCPLHQSERKYFVQIGEPICRVTTLTSGIWPLFDETWLYFAEKSPARRLIFSKFRTGARQTSVRRLVGALLTSRFPCPIVKQEKAACHFCPHAAHTPARNAARRRFTDVSFWEF